jgi:glutamate synthase domain-containing protein 1
MVRHQVGRSLTDPAQVADAKLSRLQKRGGQGQAGGIGQACGSTGKPLRCFRPEAILADDLRSGKVQAEKITAVIGHTNILTVVGVFQVALTPQD